MAAQMVGHRRERECVKRELCNVIGLCIFVMFTPTPPQKRRSFICCFVAFIQHAQHFEPFTKREIQHIKKMYLFLFSMACFSDDLFSLDYCPGKTLCIGASYVSLECAGFLAGIGLDVTVMVRSILLRGFDQQCAEIIGDYMKNHKVKFIRGAVPKKVSSLDSTVSNRILRYSKYLWIINL